MICLKLILSQMVLLYIDSLSASTTSPIALGTDYELISW